MIIYTQNIFKYSNVRDHGISRFPIKINKIMLVSKRSKLGKFLEELKNIINNENCNISINTYNKYGYIDLKIELDDKFENSREGLEKIGYRSNY